MPELEIHRESEDAIDTIGQRVGVVSVVPGLEAAMRTVCSQRIALCTVLFLVGPALPQTASDREIAGFAEKAAIRALNFKQGDLASLMDAREDFTPEGWARFMKSLAGFLDEKGAPKFTSEFIASGSASWVGRVNGMVQLTIPGRLIQTQNASRTTYERTRIDVQVNGEPAKIVLLTTVYQVK